VKSSATIEAVLAVAPPEWKGTKHGRRSTEAVKQFALWTEYRALREGARIGLTFSEPNLAVYLDSMEVAGSTRNRALSAILTIWRRAHRRGLLDCPPPSGLYAREPKGRRRVLSPQEEPRLLAALAEPYRSLATFLLASGLRVGEALALTWADVYVIPDGVSVAVRDSKNGDARVVPVHWVGDRRFWPDIATRLPVGPFKKVSHSAFDHAFRAAKATLGLAGDRELVPHSLRHTYATRLVVAGVPLSVVARLLGHRTVRTTMRYSHVSDQDAAEWIRRVSK